MKCGTCQEKIQVGFMCDEDHEFSVLCEKCFPKTCEKEHNEDCLTVVYSDD